MKKLLSGALALTLGVTCVGALAGCDNPDQEAVQTAMSAIKAMYVDKYVDASTPNDYELVGQYPINGTYCPITWTVNVTEGVSVKAMDETSKTVTVDVNEKSPTAVEYELTASITYKKATETYTFKNLKVPAYVVNTYADYISAKKGDKLRVTGTVTGFAKKGDGATANTIFMQDTDGGYYVYSLASGTLPEGLAIGKKLTVTGEYDLYNGLRELKSATVESMEDGTAVAPKDITDLVKAAEDSKDATIVGMQSQLVTIKGAQLHNNTTNNSYYCFKLGKVDSYVRISSSDCPTGADNQAAIKAAHAANYGKTATVTGLITVYSDAFYIVPVDADAFKDFAETDTAPKDRVSAEEKTVKVATSITAKGDTPLPKPTNYHDVTFKWESANTDILKIAEDGSKMTVDTLPAEVTSVKLTLTITCGTENKKKTFNVVIGKLNLEHAGTEADPLSAADVNKIFAVLSEGSTYQENGADKQFYIKGYVTDAGALNAKKDDPTTIFGLKDVYIADTKDATKENSVWVYNINWGEAMEKADANPLKVGDLIVVKGFLKDYKGDKEVAQGSVNGKNVYPVITSWTKSGETETPDTPETPETPPTLEESASPKFDFSSATGTGTQLTKETALTLFNSACNAKSHLTGIEATYVYDGAGKGGAKADATGIIKMGKSKTAGELKLTFDKAVTKVEIKCHDFYAKSEQYPTNDRKISVNGSEAVLPYNETAAGEVVTFTLAESATTITINTSERAYVYEIVVYFAE